MGSAVVAAVEEAAAWAVAAAAAWAKGAAAAGVWERSRARSFDRHGTPPLRRLPGKPASQRPRRAAACVRSRSSTGTGVRAAGSASTSAGACHLDGRSRRDRPRALHGLWCVQRRVSERGAVARAADDGARTRCHGMSRPIRIAVASGKGGTGKTTIATNLAVVLAESGDARRLRRLRRGGAQRTHLPQADHPGAAGRSRYPFPRWTRTRCTLCGACGRACRYSAILVLPKKVLTFPKLCHGCGGCTLACPEGAIREVPRVIGVVEEGAAGDVAFLQREAQRRRGHGAAGDPCGAGDALPTTARSCSTRRRERRAR